MSHIRDLQTAAVERIKSDAYFTGIYVAADDPKEILNQAEIAQYRPGISVIIYLAEAANPAAETPGPELSMTWAAQVVENVPVNRGPGGTGKHILDLVERVAALLHHHAFQSHTVFTFEKLALIDVDSPSLVAYELQFACYTGIQYTPTT